MMSNFLFLRGAWDERTQNSLDTDDDMWLHLFEELLKLYNAHGVVWFNGKRNEIIKSNKSYEIVCCEPNKMSTGGFKYIIARGGFDYYLSILKQSKKHFIIRYGAGKRFMPEPEIDYGLVLVDTHEQKFKVKEANPAENCHLFIKPAAKHFEPANIEKEFDVCYIANQDQARFKGIEYVYKTCPSDISILHLGYHGKFVSPTNVTCRRVDRINMAAEINKCRVGIVPYDSVDSCPRVIPEMLACGLPLIILNTVNFWEEKYANNSTISNKKNFWGIVKHRVLNYGKEDFDIARNLYKNKLSLPVAGKHLKEIIDGEFKKRKNRW